jgi:Periplasmic copper-binding protein (NosD)
MRRSHLLVAAVAAAALLVPAGASAQNYPPPSNPGGTGKTHGKGRTLTVCKKGCDYKRIQKAIDAASGKDTVKVKKGTYREGVHIIGKRYDGFKLIGDPKHPDRVIINGKGLPKGPNQNAVIVNAADDVTIEGFHARNYKANCFFSTNNEDYVLNHLVAERCGSYGIYAFNSKGGKMINSEAYYNPDSGFYVGQTPPQKGRKKRTLLKNLDSWGNVLGFSGTNVRYTTITKSRWYNNGAGIVPNTLTSEKYYPPTGNVISHNQVFWNNFNFYYAAPFKIPQISAADLPYPIGVGILLYGSQDTIVEKNDIFGNYLGGLSAIPAVHLMGNKDPKVAEAAILRNNTVRGNNFGGGGDLNGRDMIYDGSGSGNCFETNTTRSPNIPADNTSFVGCPGPNPNVAAPGALSEALGISLGDPKNPASFEAHWIKHPHPARKGVKPLERYPG